MKSAPDPARRGFWLKHLHRWHWISSALCLVGMMLFAITGITLNHAASISATPEVTMREGVLPPPILAALPKEETPVGPIPATVRDWLADELDIRATDAPAEWSAEEVFLALPRAGGDGALTIERASGAVSYENTDRGWISWLNDLHKGRNTGTAWFWFIDVFAVACIVFTVTGLFLLQLHAGGRPTTWPMVGLGLVAPLILIILFIH